LEKAAEAERDARCLDLAMELKWSQPGRNLGGTNLQSAKGLVKPEVVVFFFFETKKGRWGAILPKKRCYFCKRQFE